jgi:CDP-glycerol glycerophosphotransferase (TagB/SpsB family)
LVDETEAKEVDRAQRIAAHIAATDALVAKYGSLADEFSNL